MVFQFTCTCKNDDHWNCKDNKCNCMGHPRMMNANHGEK